MIFAHVAGLPAEELLLGLGAGGAGALLLAVRVRLAAHVHRVRARLTPSRWASAQRHG